MRRSNHFSLSEICRITARRSGGTRKELGSHFRRLVVDRNLCSMVRSILMCAGILLTASKLFQPKVTSAHTFSKRKILIRFVLTGGRQTLQY